MHKLKGLVAAALGITAAALVVAAVSLAGPPAVNDRGTVTDGPYATDFCGGPGTEVGTGSFHTMLDSSVTSVVDNELFKGVVTATATGKSLELAGASTDHATLTDNGDGTGTVKDQGVGLVIRFKVPNGPVLKDADGK